MCINRTLESMKVVFGIVEIIERFNLPYGAAIAGVKAWKMKLGCTDKWQRPSILSYRYQNVDTLA